MARRRGPSRGGMGGGMGGANMNQLMKQAQKMQKDMEEAQAEVAAMEITHTAGGGMVTVKVNGEHKLVDLQIEPDAVDPEDVEILQDTIIAAINGAMEKIEEASEERMAQVSGGLGGAGGLGGLPF